MVRALKAVIIDDEEIIIGLIRRLGAWEELGIEVVGTASDGLQGRALIREVRPDIVILDIRMPGLDGLEMVKRCLEEGIGAHFIIVSGHQEFTYAKQAISYQISDYLVKPIDRDELNHALRRICELVKRSERDQTERRELQSALEEQETQLWNGFFDRLREGKAPQALPGVPEREGTRLCIAIAAFDIAREQLPLCTPHLREHLKFLILEKLSGFADTWAFGQQDRACCVLFRYLPKQAEAVRGGLFALAPLLDRYAQGFGGIRATLGMSGDAAELEQLPARFRQAERCLLYRFYSEPGKLYIYDDAIRSFDREVSSLGLPEGLSARLQVLFERRDGAGLCQELESLHTGDTAMRGVRSRILLERFFEEFFSLVKGLGLFDAEAEKAQREVEWLCGTQPGTKALFGRAKALLAEQFARLDDSRALWNDRHIRAARQYIAAHYSQDIQLDDVAAAIGLNAAYLSSLFKAKSGMTYSEHLLRERMEAAKQALARPGATVKEVCAGVGYRDVKYFSRLFRQYTGVNPSLYQKMHSILP